MGELEERKGKGELRGRRVEVSFGFEQRRRGVGKEKRGLGLTSGLLLSLLHLDS